MVAEGVAGVAHSGDEPCGGAEVVDHVAGMQSMGQLAPVGQVGRGDLLTTQHVHGTRSLSLMQPQRHQTIAASALAHVEPVTVPMNVWRFSESSSGSMTSSISPLPRRFS